VERRDFLKIFSVGTVAAMSGELVMRRELPVPVNPMVPFEDMDATTSELMASIEMMSTPAPRVSEFLRAFQADDPQEIILAATASPDLNQYLNKMRHFEESDREDVYLSREQYPFLISTFKRIDRVQNLVGHGNFNVVSFDEMMAYGRRYASVGAFTSGEKAFLEELFSANARQYGFLGEKVITRLTESVPERERQKIGQTGHFLYRGESVALYGKLKKDMGDAIVLTSGIRSVVKQTHLFLAKTIQSKGNLSRASRSLAPPGHSYHGIGDFDVGKLGFGRRNFSEDFAKTDEFRRLVELGYVDIRYPRDNMFGVRYEPWHIKVV